MSSIVDFLLDTTQSHSIEASEAEGTTVHFVYKGLNISIRLRAYNIPLDEFKQKHHGVREPTILNFLTI